LVKTRTHYIQDKDYLAAVRIAPLNIPLVIHLAYLMGVSEQILSTTTRILIPGQRGYYLKRAKQINVRWCRGQMNQERLLIWRKIFLVILTGCSSL
jgi:hypothetical protein